MTSKVKSFLQAMLELSRAAVHIIGRSRQFFLIETAQCLAYGILVQIYEWMAIRFLVARVDERIE